MFHTTAKMQSPITKTSKSVFTRQCWKSQCGDFDFPERRRMLLVKGAQKLIYRPCATAKSFISIGLRSVAASVADPFDYESSEGYRI